MCDESQKGENSIALEYSERKIVSQVFNMGDTKYPCVCRRTKLPRRGVTQRGQTDGQEKKL